MAISASEARARLFPLIQKVNDDQEAIEITSRSGNVVLMPAAEYSAWQTTNYLLSSPANARRLRESFEAAERGEIEYHELDLD